MEEENKKTEEMTNEGVEEMEETSLSPRITQYDFSDLDVRWPFKVIVAVFTGFLFYLVWLILSADLSNSCFLDRLLFTPFLFWTVLLWMMGCLLILFPLEYRAQFFPFTKLVWNQNIGVLITAFGGVAFKVVLEATQSFEMVCLAFDNIPIFVQYIIIVLLIPIFTHIGRLIVRPKREKW